MNESRSPFVGVVGATVSILLLVICALLPTLVGDSHETWMSLCVLSFLGTAGFLGWIVWIQSTATRAWIVPLGIVAAGCILIGASTALKNYNDYSFYSSQLTSARETTERARTERGKDGAGYTLDAIERFREVENRMQEIVDSAKRGGLLSAIFLAVGILSATKFTMLVRGRPSGS